METNTLEAKSKAGEQLIDQLKWRYATKKFDATKKIDDKTFAVLEEALRLSASSYGMQPWKFIVVTDEAKKKELSAASFGQMQPADCSHLVVIARATNVDKNYVQHYVDVVGKMRNMGEDKKEGFAGMLNGFIERTPEDVKATWTAAQCYIALGFLLTSAAALGVDACPMEGFDKAKFDAILDLPAKNCTSVVICPLGYRSADDAYASLTKVRFCAEETVIRV